MNFHFWGLRGSFSATVLASLLTADKVPQAVIVPDNLPGRSITPLPPPTHLPLPVQVKDGFLDPVQLAWQNHIPVWAVGDLKHPQTIATLSADRPDLAIVACFNRRVPPHMLAMPVQGFLNLHPSLLPAYRGPAPLFWLFRHAATAAMGVTIHQMDAGLDTGDIIAQQPLAFPDGISGREADLICAREGTTLLINILNELSLGKLTTRKQPVNASTYSWPTPADFTLDTAWPVRRAYNFMRATAEWQIPYPVTVDGESFRLSQAISFLPDAPAYSWKQVENEIWIRFRPGSLHATLLR